MPLGRILQIVATTLALCGIVVGLPACSSGGDEEGAERCPPGTRPFVDLCIDRGDRGDEDAGDDAERRLDVAPTVDAADDPASDVEDSSEDALLCEPESEECLDEQTSRYCSVTGQRWIEVGCAEDARCHRGRCVLSGSLCVGGDVVGCASLTELRVCNERGFAWTTEACPDERPNCVDGECTEDVCRPGAQVCDGDKVYRCNEGGMTLSLVNDCAESDRWCIEGRCVDACAGDGKATYLGCEFYAAQLDNVNTALVQPWAVTLSNGGGEAVNIAIDAEPISYFALDTIPPGSLTTIELPPAGVDDTGFTDAIFRIRATGAVTAHQFNPLNNVDVFTNDASLLLPRNAFGTRYVVLGAPNLGSGVEALKSFVTIIVPPPNAAEVRVTPSVNTQPGRGIGRIEAGTTEMFEVPRSGALSIAASAELGADLSGTVIESDVPIAVFSGSECTNIPIGTPFCDHVEQQLFPVSTWGKTHVLSKFSPRGEEPDVWKVVADEAGTTLSTNPPIEGVDGVSLDPGDVLRFELRGDAVLESSEPVLVGQFMVGSAYPGPEAGCDPERGIAEGCAMERHPRCRGSAIGDPAFTLAVPVEQFRTSYAVLTPDGYRENHINIIAPGGVTPRLDGEPVTVSPVDAGSADDGTSWQVFRVPVSVGVHDIDAEEAVGLTAYGYDCDVSYAYPGGLDLESIAE